MIGMPVLHHSVRKLLSLSLPLTLVTAFSTAAVAAEQDSAYLDAADVRLRATYETVHLPAGETMGFLGATALVDINSWLAAGAATYGALTGRRGGFITLGGAAELRREIQPWLEIDSGLFVGAGGGRGGLQLSGGGLMLRYHLEGVLKSAQWGNLGAGISYIDFPNGTINSLQPYISYAYPFRAALTSGWFEGDTSAAEAYEAGRAEHELAVVAQSYRVPAGVKQDNGLINQHAIINLFGAEWNRYISERLFLRLSSAGAIGGQSNGYMQVLFGGGYRLPLLDTTSLKFSAAAGVAGGGAVATGGGLLAEATAALQQRFGEHLFVELAGGYVVAPDGDFRAASFSGKLGYRFHTPDLTEKRIPVSALQGFTPLNLRIRTVHQSYFGAAAGWRTSYADRDIHLLGLQGDYFINRTFFISGQGIAAYRGKAGAFMTGMAGAGVHLPLFGSPLYAEVELLGGAAGGGGLAVGGGLVWQGSGGVGYQLNDRYSVQVGFGYMSAPKDAFRARVLTLSIGYRFGLLVR